MKLKIFLTCIIIFVLQSQSIAQSRTIHVSANYNLLISPDFALFDIGIRTVKKEIAEAQEINRILLDSLLKLLDKYGVPEDAITLYPFESGIHWVLEDDERKKDGYFEQLKINFQLSDLTNYFEIREKLSFDKNIHIKRAKFGINEREKFEKDALEKATIEAKERATLMAKALGAGVGRALEIYEGYFPQNYSGQRVHNLSNTSSASQTVSLVNERFDKVNIYARVSVVFELVDIPKQAE